VIKQIKGGDSITSDKWVEIQNKEAVIANIILIVLKTRLVESV